MPSKNHILIVDSDKEFRDMLIDVFKSQGYRATGVADPDKLAAAIAIQRPDVILLEMVFDTGANGIEICRNLCAWCPVPVIILSAITDEETKVAALDAGADDYVIKPFGINELLARVRAIRRRSGQRQGIESPVLSIGDLTIDLEDRRVRLRDRPIHLTRKEYGLLKCLMLARGRLVTYDKLFTMLWKTDQVFDRVKLRGLVMQLRNKLGDNLDKPLYIITEVGVGYRFNVELANAE